MARLTNSPLQSLTLDVERRKSFSLQVNLIAPDQTPIDLTGCTLRLVAKHFEYDNDLYDTTNIFVNSTAEVVAPETGVGVFSLQAAEVDQTPGEHHFSIVLWTYDGFSVTLVKGLLNILPNTESASVQHTYTSGTATAGAEITMRGSQAVSVIASSLGRDPSRAWQIVGYGRPDDLNTIEGVVLTAVNTATIGTVFVSVDGAGVGIWAWRLRSVGTWVPIERPLTWSDLTDPPATMPPGPHTHTISNVTGLQAALDGADTGWSIQTTLAGFTGTTLRGRSNNRTAQIRGASVVRNAGAFTTTFEIFITLPSAIRPSAELQFLVPAVNPAQGPLSLKVSTNGNCALAWSGLGTAPTAATYSATWLLDN